MAFTYRDKRSGRETQVLEPREFERQALADGAGEDYAAKLGLQRRHTIELMDDSDVWERVDDAEKTPVKRAPAKKAAESDSNS